MSFVTDIFKKPKIPKPTPPPNTPTRPDARTALAGAEASYNTLVSSGSAQGLSRKANTRRRTLLGGS